METGKTGGHWVPCKVGNVEAHNERREDYLEGVKKAGKKLYFFTDLTKNNSSWINEKYAGKTCAEIFEEMKEVYQEKKHQAPQLKEVKFIDKKTGKEKTRAGWSPLREMCVPIKEDTKPKDFDYFRKWAQRYGLEIVRIDLHQDEGHEDKETGERKLNRHAHIVGSFFDWETASSIKLGPEVMSEMQTVLAISLGMERGERKEATGKKYLDHQTYRKMMEEVEEAKEELSRIESENEELKGIQKDLEKEIKTANTKLKGLTTMIDNLEAQKANLEDEISDLEKNFREGKISIEELQGKRKEMQQQIDAIEEKIADKKAKLAEAGEQLQTLIERRHALKMSSDEITRKINSDMPKLEEKNLRDMNVTMWSEATRELPKDYEALQKFSEELPKDLKEKFDEIINGSFMEDVAQQGANMVGMATALFMGFIDQATKFAQGCGGGGNTPGEGWGRKENEDEEAFRRRCALMGRQMMRPATQQVQKRGRGMH